MAADRFFDGVAFHAKRVEYVNDAGLSLYSEEIQAKGMAQLFSNRVGLAWLFLNSDSVGVDAPRFRDRMDELLTIDVLDAPSYYERLRAEIEK